MFIESFEYSLEIVRCIIKIYINKNENLPITTIENDVRCLDYDMDKVCFSSIVDSSVKVTTVNPYDKTHIEVMEMV